MNDVVDKIAVVRGNEVQRVAVEQEQADADERIGEIVAKNLLRLRMKRQLTLEALARLSGVSRAMLAQVEAGKSTPTIRVLFKVAKALQVSVAAFTEEGFFEGVALLPLRQAQHVVQAGGKVISRELSPGKPRHQAEFYEIRLAGQAQQERLACAAGTVENLVVAQGILEIKLSNQSHTLAGGDAILFCSDQPHVFRNPAQCDMIAYRVIHLPEPPHLR